MSKLDLNDFMGKKYRHLTIIGIVEPNTADTRQSKVKVKCDCGRESIKTLNNVLRLPSGCSKGCEMSIANQNIKMLDKYINKKYNHLTIKSYVGRIKDPSYYDGGAKKIYCKV